MPEAARAPLRHTDKNIIILTVFFGVDPEVAVGGGASVSGPVLEVHLQTIVILVGEVVHNLVAHIVFAERSCWIREQQSLHYTQRQVLCYRRMNECTQNT